MKKIALLCSVVVMVLSLVSCGDKEASTEVATPEEEIYFATLMIGGEEFDRKNPGVVSLEYGAWEDMQLAKMDLTGLGCTVTDLFWEYCFMKKADMNYQV